MSSVASAAASSRATPSDDQTVCVLGVFKPLISQAKLLEMLRARHWLSSCSGSARYIVIPDNETVAAMRRSKGFGRAKNAEVLRLSDFIHQVLPKFASDHRVPTEFEYLLPSNQIHATEARAHGDGPLVMPTYRQYHDFLLRRRLDRPHNTHLVLMAVSPAARAMLTKYRNEKGMHGAEIVDTFTARVDAIVVVSHPSEITGKVREHLQTVKAQEDRPMVITFQALMDKMGIPTADIAEKKASTAVPVSGIDTTPSTAHASTAVQTPAASSKATFVPTTTPRPASDRETKNAAHVASVPRRITRSQAGFVDAGLTAASHTTPAPAVVTTHAANAHVSTSAPPASTADAVGPRHKQNLRGHNADKQPFVDHSVFAPAPTATHTTSTPAPARTTGKGFVDESLLPNRGATSASAFEATSSDNFVDEHKCDDVYESKYDDAASQSAADKQPAAITSDVETEEEVQPDVETHSYDAVHAEEEKQSTAEPQAEREESDGASGTERSVSEGSKVSEPDAPIPKLVETKTTFTGGSVTMCRLEVAGGGFSKQRVLEFDEATFVLLFDTIAAGDSTAAIFFFEQFEERARALHDSLRAEDTQVEAEGVMEVVGAICEEIQLAWDAMQKSADTPARSFVNVSVVAITTLGRDPLMPAVSCVSIGTNSMMIVVTSANKSPSETVSCYEVMVEPHLSRRAVPSRFTSSVVELRQHWEEVHEWKNVPMSRVVDRFNNAQSLTNPDVEVRAGGWFGSQQGLAPWRPRAFEGMADLQVPTAPGAVKSYFLMNEACSYGSTMANDEDLPGTPSATNFVQTATRALSRAQLNIKSMSQPCALHICVDWKTQE
jgi:hypothetical protein